jgi:hypothetical protein
MESRRIVREAAEPIGSGKKGEPVNLKRRLMALATAAFLAVPIASSTTAFAAGPSTAQAEPASHGDDSDEQSAADDAGDAGTGDDGGGGNNEDAADSNRPEEAGHDEGEGPGGNGSCTSVSSVAVCADEPSP